MNGIEICISYAPSKEGNLHLIVMQNVNPVSPVLLKRLRFFKAEILDLM